MIAHLTREERNKHSWQRKKIARIPRASGSLTYLESIESSEGGGLGYV